MKVSSDSVQFESQAEIEELMKLIDKLVKQNPSLKNNETLKEFFYSLDKLNMEW